MATLKRVLAGVFGGVLLAIGGTVAYILLIGVPGSLMALLSIAAVAFVIGAILGSLFPKFFGLVFDAFMDV